MRRSFSILLLSTWWLTMNTLLVKAQQVNAVALNNAFEAYWNSNTLKESDEAIHSILTLHPSFDEVYAHLKTGRSYSSNVTRGFIEWYSVAPPNIQMYCLLFIPRNYEPTKKYSVRVFLHGSVSNTDPQYVNNVINRNDPSYDTIQEIIVYPSGNFFSMWWTDRQFDHVMQILTRLKRLYHIDENNIRIGGVSDGAIGTYFFANCDPTPWACYTSYIGHPGALDALNNKQIYLGNFSCKPFFIVNGGRDQVFEPKIVLPYVKEILKVNPKTRFILVDSSGHNLNWLNVLSDSITHFVLAHPRQPFPDSLFWETENADRYNRNHWVIINRIGKVKENAVIDDPNTILIDGASRRAFHRDTTSGIINVIRSGNEIRVLTKNVKEYTLLLSPDQFDFALPVKVITNGEISFDSIIEKNPETLLRWFARDQDRTMLFGAELNIEAGKKWKGRN